MKKEIISVIILNYNSPEVTLKCIKSFINQKDIDFEIIFVENSDNLELKQSMKNMLNEWKFLENKKFKYIDVWYNSWFAEWNNIWWENASWNYVLMFNSDAWIEDDFFLRNFIENFKKLDKNIVAASPNMVWWDGFSQHRKKWYYLYTNLMEWIVALNKKPKIKKDKYWNDYGCLFACVLFDKTRLKELKKIKWLKIPFDDKYFLYNEDMYLMFILDLFWYKTVVLQNKDLKFYHLGSYSWNKVNDLKVFHWEKNRILNILLFYSWKSEIFLIPILILTCIWRLILETKNAKYLLKSYWWVIKNIWYILKQRNIIQKNRKLDDKILLQRRVHELFHEYSKLNFLNYIFKLWFKLLYIIYNTKQ